ncbi:MAG: hypothetical protein PF445_11405 [Melioribacteraceae bacterium]|jgi:hypothetical protein|nr:hypothetical protein [Melioribacteraceae bacterium]
MKNLMNVTIVLFTLALLTGSLFAQERKLDGTGNPDATKINWIDLDGDGICDNFGTDLQGANSQNKKMNKGLDKGTGAGDGTGNGFGDGTGVRPLDGTGFGKMNGGSSADGTTTLQKGSGRKINR